MHEKSRLVSKIRILSHYTDYNALYTLNIQLNARTNIVLLNTTMNRPKRPNIIKQGKNLGRFLFNFELIQTFNRNFFCVADNL